MGNTYQDENGVTQWGDRNAKPVILSKIVLMMATNHISFQDFLDYIEKGSKKYEAIRDCKSSFDEQSALIELREKGVGKEQ